MKSIVFAALMAGAMLAHAAAEIKAIRVKNHTIRVGTSADDVFAIIPATDLIDQNVVPDQSNPGSLRVTKRYHSDRKTFTLIFLRDRIDGPYLVWNIYNVVPDSPKARK